MTILTRNHATLAQEVKAHIDADAIVRGQYWDGSKGCFIGCLTHSEDPKPAFERFGLLEPLMRIAESIFEGLPDNEGRAFFAALPDAVGCDGKDLSRVHWAFLATELRILPQLDIVDTVISGMDLLAAGKEWSVDAAHSAYTAIHAAAQAANAAYADAYDHAASAATRAAYFTAAAAAHAFYRNCVDGHAYNVAAYSADVASCAAAHAAHAARAASYAASPAYVASYEALAARSADRAAYAAVLATRIRQRDTLLRLISEAPMGDELHTKEKQND